MPKQIAGSVGAGGLNATNDVCTVQYLLNCVPASSGGPSSELVIDGQCGPKTETAICNFHRANGCPQDGSVDPRGPTFRTLASYDPYPNQSLPPMGHQGGGFGPGTTDTKSSVVGASNPTATDAIGQLPYDCADTPAFVREVLLPGGPNAVPHIAHEATRFALESRTSPIHRFGIFTTEHIAAGERVIEYTGERISYREGARRRVRPHLYLFWINPGRLLDGAVGGSGAEFINHSCTPNVAPDVRDGRVFFVSLRDIDAGDELLLDYKVHGDAPLMPCRCGSAQCRGYLNAVNAD
jgi:uncharacterized protein